MKIKKDTEIYDVIEGINTIGGLYYRKEYRKEKRRKKIAKDYIEEGIKVEAPLINYKDELNTDIERVEVLDEEKLLSRNYIKIEAKIDKRKTDEIDTIEVVIGKIIKEIKKIQGDRREKGEKYKNLKEIEDMIEEIERKIEEIERSRGEMNGD